MHMNAIYDYEKGDGFLAEPVVARLEGAMSGSKVNPNYRLPAWSCPCVFGPTSRRQTYSA